MDFHYVKTLDLRRYLRFTVPVFLVLTFGFTVLSLMQSRVYYGGSLDPAVTAMASGCQLGANSNELTTTCGYFIHNTSIALIAWLGGVAVIGPFYVLWQNSQSIGTYLAGNITAGNPGGVAFLVPHGIFEIPAILISVSLGIYISHTVLDNREKEVTYRMVSHFRRTVPWFLVVVGLLGIAAFVESNVSPLFAEMIDGLI